VQAERGRVSLKQPTKASIRAFLLVVVVVFLLDRLSKQVVVAFLKLNTSLPVIIGVFHLTYVRNPGASFGLFPQFRNVYTLLSFLFLAGVVLYILLERPDRLTQIILGLIAGGTSGNAFDRVVYKAVIDWLDFRFWPIFNLADVAISCGVALLLYKLIASLWLVKKGH